MRDSLGIFERLDCLYHVRKGMAQLVEHPSAEHHHGETRNVGVSQDAQVDGRGIPQSGRPRVYSCHWRFQRNGFHFMMAHAWG